MIGGNSERLISLQDIQSELDATQAEAWEDLVRVLTHEIMNSITPVTSLAATASDVVTDVIEKVREVILSTRTSRICATHRDGRAALGQPRTVRR